MKVWSDSEECETMGAERAPREAEVRDVSESRGNSAEWVAIAIEEVDGIELVRRLDEEAYMVLALVAGVGGGLRWRNVDRKNAVE